MQRRRCRCVRSGRRRARRGYIQRRPRHRSARSTVDNALRWRREPPCYANVTERSDTAAVVLRTGKENGGASLVSSVARDTAGWVGRGQTAPVVKCAEWRGSAVGLAVVRVGAGSPERWEATSLMRAPAAPPSLHAFKEAHNSPGDKSAACAAEHTCHRDEQLLGVPPPVRRAHPRYDAQHLPPCRCSAACVALPSLPPRAARRIGTQSLSTRSPPSTSHAAERLLTPEFIITWHALSRTGSQRPQYALPRRTGRSLGHGR